MELWENNFKKIPKTSFIVNSISLACWFFNLFTNVHIVLLWRSFQSEEPQGLGLGL